MDPAEVLQLLDRVDFLRHAVRGETGKDEGISYKEARVESAGIGRQLVDAARDQGHDPAPFVNLSIGGFVDDDSLIVPCRSLRFDIEWSVEKSDASATLPTLTKEAAAAIIVEVAKGTIIVHGKPFRDISSEQALRWVKVLADHPGEWISGADLAKHDSELDGAQTHRLRQYLPGCVAELIESSPGKGSRLAVGIR